MMKKFLVILMVMIFSMCSFMVVNAEDVTLLQVADSFNNCDTVTSYKQYNMDWNAKAEGNKLILTIKSDENNASVEYTLEGSILGASFSEEEALNGLTATVILTDAIGKIHGYEDGELLETLNSDAITNYTIENEGFSIVQLENGGYEIKIDINKKMPLADMSEVYVTEQDLSDFERDILQSDEGGSFSGSKGPLRYSVSNYGEVIIYIGERDGLTERAYNSIISIIDVIDDSKESSEYFRQNYSGISEGDKSFGDYKISLNVSGEDVPEFGENYSIMKVVIGSQDNEFMEDSNDEEMFLEDENITEDSDIPSETNVVSYIIIGIIVVAIISGIIVLVIKRK